MDPRVISYAIVLVVIVAGVLAIRRLIARLSAKAAQTPMREALTSGNFYKAGRLAFEAGDWEAAAKHFKKAGRAGEAGRALKRAELWDQAAEAFEDAREFATAAACYERIGNTGAQLRMLMAANDLAAAAALSEKVGDFGTAGELLEKSGKPLEAAAMYARAGDLRRGGAIRAEAAEAANDWLLAAQEWLNAGNKERARSSAANIEDHRAAAGILMRLHRDEEAAERFAFGGAYGEAAALYERLGLYRKAALNHQRSGATERAIHCLGMDGDKVAVIKLRQALGQTDEALRVALSVPTTDPQHVPAAELAVALLIQRGDNAAAMRTILPLLDGALPPEKVLEHGKFALVALLDAKDAVRGRQILDRLTPFLEPGSADEDWCRSMQNKLAALPAVPGLRATPRVGLPASSITPEVAALAAKETETYESDFARSDGPLARLPTPRKLTPEARDDAPRRATGPRPSPPPIDLDATTGAMIGGRDDGLAPPARQRGMADLTPLKQQGWPQGVPLNLAERYGDLSRLGQGGNGVVFKAHDTLLGRQVVLKFMIQGTMPSEVARRYFLREVKLAAGLNHPNIVHIYDMGNVEGVLYYAMEFVDGAPLTAHLPAAGPVRDKAFLVSVLDQLSGALDYAHGQGLVHRDIKPDNVLVAGEGTVKLLDFGLARVLDDGFGEQSVLAGTPYYMAPEQLDGSSIDHRADIYALGVVLFRMFTGLLPFSEGNVFVAHAVQPPPDPRQFNRDLPDACARAVLRCMAKRPGERYPNCKTMAGEVKAALLGVAAGNVGVVPPPVRAQ